MKFRLSLRHAWLLSILLAAVGARGTGALPPVAELPPRPDAPDPLVMLDGSPVASKKAWGKKRRPELMALFQHYMYGWLPPRVKVAGKTTYTDPHFFDGKATLKLVTIKIGPDPAPEVHLLIVTPNQRTRRAPLFLGMNFSGNHTLVDDTNIPLPDGWMPANLPHIETVNNHATEAGRGREKDTWSLEQSIDRGYAVATYYCGDVEQDRTNAVDGVRELIHAPRLADDWGTIAAWAWGMERVVDYLERERDIDPKRIALVGHSRFGKAVILAGALDKRVAMIVPLQSGCGGTAPSRGVTGESVKQINDRFPEWFCGVFKEFNGQPERLPFDQNCLIALCAPRPVLLGAAAQDTWTNPAGAFAMLQAAGAAYRLCGAEGLAAAHPPEINQLIDSNLGYFIRPGKHSMTRGDWKFFLDFADKHLAGR
jgi:dienelactone hydrolase